MQLSINTDYANPEKDVHDELRAIAAAGFTHIQWMRHWGDDFVYHDSEIDQIATWLGELGLTMVDLHATSGIEKQWTSPQPWARAAGVELVRNRVAMTRRLGGHTIVMHLTRDGKTDTLDDCAARFCQTFEQLHADLERYDIRIALENLFTLNGNKPLVDRVLGEIDSPRLGVCYDSGHGCMVGDGLAFLERHGNRLFSLHLHDNDATSDQHALPFTGKVDWDRAAALIARSAYAGPLTLELMRPADWAGDDVSFLTEAHKRADRLAAMVDSAAAH